MRCVHPPSHLELHSIRSLRVPIWCIKGEGVTQKNIFVILLPSFATTKNKEQWCVLVGWFDGMATRLEAHPLVVRSLVSLSAGTGEQKSEARPTAPSRGRLVIGFACTRPTDFAGGRAAGRRRVVVGLLRCSDDHGSHSTFFSICIACFYSLSMHVALCF